MPSTTNRIALYASYQTGDTIPGYVQFALKHLAETQFRVVLLTNERELSQESRSFLADNGIELFLTENRGYDFGMWRRYLQGMANRSPSQGNARDEASGRETNSIEQQDSFSGNVDRLLLINDSIVYYRNRFVDYIAQAEESHADVVSLTCNDEFAPHLQSFFLYMKSEALGAFYMHLFETPEQTDFYSVTRKLEVGLSERFAEENVRMEALFHTERPIFFAYREIIEQGAGFVKRKLLQRRFDYEEKKHFIRYRAYDALNEDYLALIKKAGFDKDFLEEWFPKSSESIATRAKDFVWERAFQLVGFPIKRLVDKVRSH